MTQIRSLFVGHGTPMNAISDNSFTRTWNALGQQISRDHQPRAILSVSAHWYTRGTGVTAMTDPKTIHDFWGFPAELNSLEYDAPGDPEMAELVCDVAKPTLVVPDRHWGLDHGTWSVLYHMFPEANIPVVQLSIDATKPLAYHVELGQRLATLAQEHNVLIVGSGNIVHNLAAAQWHLGNVGFDWADRFDEDVTTLMLNNPERFETLAEHQDYLSAVPTPDHFLPLAYFAGVIAGLGKTDITAFNRERTMGSLSMTGLVAVAE